jgi:hypothetical protein
VRASGARRGGPSHHPRDRGGVGGGGDLRTRHAPRIRPDVSTSRGPAVIVCTRILTERWPTQPGGARPDARGLGILLARAVVVADDLDEIAPRSAPRARASTSCSPRPRRSTHDDVTIGRARRLLRRGTVSRRYPSAPLPLSGSASGGAACAWRGVPAGPGCALTRVVWPRGGCRTLAAARVSPRCSVPARGVAGVAEGPDPSVAFGLLAQERTRRDPRAWRPPTPTSRSGPTAVGPNDHRTGSLRRAQMAAVEAAYADLLARLPAGEPSRRVRPARQPVPRPSRAGARVPRVTARAPGPHLRRPGRGGPGRGAHGGQACTAGAWTRRHGGKPRSVAPGRRLWRHGSDRSAPPATRPPPSRGRRRALASDPHGDR